MTRSLAGFAFTLLVVLAASAAFAEDPAPTAAPVPRKVASVEGITEYAFDNGLRLLLFPDPSKPTVTVNATYLVGSRHEGYGESGMAHLLEHLVFKGTPKHPSIWKELQDHGAQFNGSTSVDRTNYFETLPATDENLEFALDLEADRMVNSFIAQKDLESEFSVVRNEFEMGENSPMRVLAERVMSTAYLWHNYGKSTIGSRADIERVPIERLQAFYRKFYQPDNCVLVIAGRFDEKRALARVAALFGAIPRPTRTLERTYTWEPAQDGEREVTLRRVGDVQAIMAAYHVCASAHEDFEPLRVLANALTADQTGRLYKALVESGLATGVSAGVDAYHDPGLLEVSVTARVDQSMPEIRKRLFEVLDGLGAATFTEEEVSRVKRSSERNFERLLSDPNRVGVAISESAACGDWRLLFLHRDRMAKVTPADVQRVAARYLKPSNRTVGVFVPEAKPDRVEVPPTPDVAALVADYKGGAGMSQGAAFEATYAAIEARTQRAALAVGMKTAFVPKETRNDQVSLAIRFRYGSEADLAGRTEAASMMERMLMRGTKKRTRRELQDRMDELKASIRVGGGGGGRGRGRRGGGASSGGTGILDAAVECGRASLPAALELLAEIVREPAFPAEEFDLLKNESLAGLEQGRSDPATLAANEIARRLHPAEPGDVRYVATPAEQIERVRAVTREQVVAVYTELLGASASEAAAVGDFDPAELTALLEKHFGDWKSPRPFARIPRVHHATKAEALVIDTPDKANATFGMAASVALNDEDPDHAAMFVANLLLGGGGSSRLVDRIRQKEGLSYSVRSSYSASALDRDGSFSVSGICNPENAEKALACAREEIERLITAGVTQAELDDARKGHRQSVELSLSDDSSLAAMLAGALYLGRTLKFSEDFLARVEALTPETVTATFAKHVKPDGLLAVRAGDFSGKAPKEEGKKGE